MAAKTKGIAHLYGISGTITNATVLSTNFSDSHKVEDSTVNESGVEIERRYDDEHTEGTITIRMRAAYVPPTIGSILVYETISYEIPKIDRSQEAKGFRTMVLSVKKSEGITY